MMPRRRLQRATLLLLAVLAITACGEASDPPLAPRPADPPPTSTPTSSRPEEAEPLPAAVGLENAVPPLRLQLRSKSGYEDVDGVLILDVLERDTVFGRLSIYDAEGRPVRGVRPDATLERDSHFLRRTGDEAYSDESGTVRFALLAGTMGEERVRISAGGAVVSLLLNVISERAAGYSWLADVEDVLDWNLLFQADLRWTEQHLFATFPKAVMAKSGQTVKLAGFVMPLEMTREHTHFVLTSSPPGCYFHVPGGPAGAVEVFATKPLEANFDPVLLEGRFEALESSEIGVVYRLHEARALAPPMPAP